MYLHMQETDKADEKMEAQKAQLFAVTQGPWVLSRNPPCLFYKYHTQQTYLTSVLQDT